MARRIPIGEAIEGFPVEEPSAPAQRIPVGDVIEGAPPEPRSRISRVPVASAIETPMSRQDMARFGVTPSAQGGSPMIGTSSGQVALNAGDAAAEAAARRLPAPATTAPGPGPLRAILQEGGGRAMSGLRSGVNYATTLTGQVPKVDKVAGGLGLVSGVAQAGSGLVDAAQNGINANNTMDVASGAMMASRTPVGLAAGTALAAGNQVGRYLNDNVLSDGTKDMIGGAVNKGLRAFGLGVNDDALKQLNSGAYAGPRIVPGAGPTASAQQAASYSNEGRNGARPYDSLNGFKEIAPGINRKGSFYTDDVNSKPGFGVSTIGGSGVTDYERKLSADYEARQAREAGSGPSATFLGDSRRIEQDKINADRGTASFMAGSSLNRNAREGVNNLKDVADRQAALDANETRGVAERSATNNAASRLAGDKYQADQRFASDKYQTDGALSREQYKIQAGLIQANQLRGLTRQAVAASNGDLAKAGKLLTGLGYGDAAKSLYEGSDKEQSAADAKDSAVSNRQEFLRKSVAGRFVDPATGKVDEARLGQFMAGAEQLTDGNGRQLANMPAEEQQQRLTASADQVSLKQGIRREPGWFDAFRATPLEMDPNNVDFAGATAAPAGLLRGLATRGVSAGDMRITLKDGRQGYISREQLKDSSPSLLKKMGVKIEE